MSDAAQGAVGTVKIFGLHRKQSRNTLTHMCVRCLRQTESRATSNLYTVMSLTWHATPHRHRCALAGGGSTRRPYDHYRIVLPFTPSRNTFTLDIYSLLSKSLLYYIIHIGFFFSLPNYKTRAGARLCSCGTKSYFPFTFFWDKRYSMFLSLSLCERITKKTNSRSQ